MIPMNPSSPNLSSIALTDSGASALRSMANFAANPLHLDGVVEQCQTLQEEELEVLQSIFPEYLYSKKSGEILKLEIPVEFAASQVVNIIHVPNSPSSSSQTITREKISLSVLPPIILHISLPPSYPTYGPPDIVSLEATHEWLEDVEDIKNSLLTIYELGEQTLYNWIEYLRRGEFLLERKTTGSKEESHIGLSHRNPRVLASTLLDFETSYKSIRFSQNSYMCSICLATLKGTKCIQLECCHVFCRECLEDFWKMWIKEGNVSKVGCPDPDCVKEGKESCEEEVARIVTPSQLDHWRRLRRRRDLERDPSTMRCPRKQCQDLVPQPKGIDPNSSWARLRQCPQCQFNFCSFCKHTWHGPISSCPASFKNQVAQEYLATTQGSKEQTSLELRYGRTFLKRIVTQYNEEKKNDDWITYSTTVCPGCASPVQKSGGCNHMTCSRCTQHFCYRCGLKLDPKHPYVHFREERSNCYQKLFDWDDR